MILVCGIHGSGKDQYSNNLKLKKDMNAYTASQLINQTLPLRQYKTKKIDQIDSRQHILLETMKEIVLHEENFILNAHLCLINEKGEVERISIDVFKNMPITEIHLVECSAKEIEQRMYRRDEISWDIRFIQSFLEEEKKYAIELSQLLNVTLSVINTSSDNKKNIILPIAPQYIEKILSGEKKYEYRKRLCKNNISRMYLYATAPVKGIVGEAEVIGKLEKNPKDLWNLTFQDSGIKVELFYKYFEKFGLMGKTGVDLPGEAATIMHKKENVGQVELATMSFGQSFQVTPMQMATTVCSLVNGGKRITPHFGIAVYDAESGEKEETISYGKRKRILSKEMSEKMRKILETVVSEGGGKKAQIEGYRIGGKTATSQTLPRSANRYIGSFIGFAPADDPQVAAMAIIYNPQGIYYGGTIAAPVVRDIFDNILPYLGIEREENP